jgi:hypothetical protein
MPMPVRREVTFDILDNLGTAHDKFLQILASRDYKVINDSQIRIVAKHNGSFTIDSHELKVQFVPAGDKVKVVLGIDMWRWRWSEKYLRKLNQELSGLFATANTQRSPTQIETPLQKTEAMVPASSNSEKPKEKVQYLIAIKGMKDSEYQFCVSNLGLLEGEEIKLQYVCYRQTISPPSIWDGKSRTESKKGLLVFTNDNMIFMQQEGAWSSNYAQALRFPLESISGLVSGGTLVKHIRIVIGVSGSSEQHEFINFVSTFGQQQIQEVRADIEKLLKVAREEKKRLAVEAMTKGTVPTMIFCRFCGARNKADQSNCANCGAVLT